MIKLTVLGLMAMAIIGSTLAAPQYGRPQVAAPAYGSNNQNHQNQNQRKRLPSHCRLEWKTVNVIEEREVTNKVCKDVYK